MHKMEEHELPDDYPVYAGFFYVVNNRVWQSPISVNVEKVKFLFFLEGLQVFSFKSCDIVARNLSGLNS